MRFGYLETMTDPHFMKPLAIAAEEAGFDAFVVPGANFPTMASIAAWEREFKKPVGVPAKCSSPWHGKA